MTAIDYFDGVPIRTSTGTTWLFFDGTITAYTLSVSVSHNLGVIPTGYSVTPKDDYAIGVEVTAVTSSIITVSIKDAQPVDANFKVGVAA